MRQDFAHNAARWALKAVRPILTKALNAKQPLEFNRLFLKTARDRLHETCVHFEEQGGAEEFEDWYLGLFDALSLLTQALGTKVINRQCVVESAARLQELAELLAAVPV